MIETMHKAGTKDSRGAFFRKLADQQVTFPDEIKSDQWRALFFMKDGQVFRGCKIYPTEAEATVKAASDDKHVKSSPPNCWWVADDGSFPGSAYSHFMVIPWPK